MFLVAIVGYGITLIGCGSATSLEQEIVWRLVQGTFGAALLPLGQVIAVNAFPKTRYAQATSLWALGFVSANVFAPTIAGVIVEEFGWPWIFYLPIPFAIGVFVASWFLVPDAEKNVRPMPWTGLLSLIIGVSLLQLMLARGERLDWFESPEIVLEAVVSVALIYYFILHSISARHPYFDRGLFADRDFVMGQVFAFIVGGVMFLPLLLLPLMLQPDWRLLGGGHGVPVALARRRFGDRPAHHEPRARADRSPTGPPVRAGAHRLRDLVDVQWTVNVRRGTWSGPVSCTG